MREDGRAERTIRRLVGLLLCDVVVIAAAVLFLLLPGCAVRREVPKTIVIPEAMPESGNAESLAAGRPVQSVSIVYMINEEEKYRCDLTEENAALRAYLDDMLTQKVETLAVAANELPDSYFALTYLDETGKKARCYLYKKTGTQPPMMRIENKVYSLPEERWLMLRSLYQDEEAHYFTATMRYGEEVLSWALIPEYDQYEEQLWENAAQAKNEVPYVESANTLVNYVLTRHTLKGQQSIMLFEAGYKTQIQDEEKKRAMLLNDNWIYAVDSNFEHVNILKKDLNEDDADEYVMWRKNEHGLYLCIFDQETIVPVFQENASIGGKIFLEDITGDEDPEIIALSGNDEDHYTQLTVLSYWNENVVTVRSVPSFSTPDGNRVSGCKIHVHPEENYRLRICGEKINYIMDLKENEKLLQICMNQGIYDQNGGLLKEDELTSEQSGLISNVAYRVYDHQLGYELELQQSISIEGTKDRIGTVTSVLHWDIYKQCFEVVEQTWQNTHVLREKIDLLTGFDMDGDSVSDEAWWEEAQDIDGSQIMRLCVELSSGKVYETDFFGDHKDTLFAVDLTGDGLDEIIAQAEASWAVGGAGCYDAFVLSAPNGEWKPLPLPSQNGETGEDGHSAGWASGYPFELYYDDEFLMRVESDKLDAALDRRYLKERLTDPDSAHSALYEEDGTLVYGGDRQKGSDGIYAIEPVSNELGWFDLRISQYIYHGGHSSGEGQGVSVIRWNGEAYDIVRQRVEENPLISGQPVHYGDLDGDGLQDRIWFDELGGSTKGRMYLTIQTGAGITLRKRIEGQGYFSVQLADLDHDGTEDLLVHADEVVERFRRYRSDYWVYSIKKYKWQLLELPRMKNGRIGFEGVCIPEENFRIRVRCEMDEYTEYLDQNGRKRFFEAGIYDAQGNVLNTNEIPVCQDAYVRLKRQSNGIWGLELSQSVATESLDQIVTGYTSFAVWNGRWFRLRQQDKIE